LIPQTTYDGVKLEITFPADAGSVFFGYAFASEDQNEYTNSSYNDGFALLLRLRKGEVAGARLRYAWYQDGMSRVSLEFHRSFLKYTERLFYRRQARCNSS
jgi:hypothetical protein